MMQDGERKFYRVQKLDSGINMVMFRLHTASTLDDRNQELHLTINKQLISQWNLQIEKVNAIGKLQPIHD